MNTGHKNGRMRNRIKRCAKRLNSQELVSEQRNNIIQRKAELEQLLRDK